MDSESRAHTGEGVLALRDGRKLAVTYQFGSTYDAARTGYLLCDISALDPAALIDTLKLSCEDGNEILVAVTHSTDRLLMVTGRVVTTPIDAGAAPAGGAQS